MALNERDSKDFYPPTSCHFDDLKGKELNDQQEDRDRIVCTSGIDVHYKLNAREKIDSSGKPILQSFNPRMSSPACPSPYTGKTVNNDQEDEHELKTDCLKRSKHIHGTKPYRESLYKKFDPRLKSKTVVIRDYVCKTPLELSNLSDVAKAVLNDYPNDYVQFLSLFVDNMFGEAMKRFLQQSWEKYEALKREKEEINRISWSFYSAIHKGKYYDSKGSFDTTNIVEPDNTLQWDAKLIEKIQTLNSTGRANTELNTASDLIDLTPCLDHHIAVLKEMHASCKSFATSELHARLMLEYANMQGRNMCDDFMLIEDGETPEYRRVTLKIPINLFSESSTHTEGLESQDLDSTIRSAGRTHADTDLVQTDMLDIPVGYFAGQVFNSGIRINTAYDAETRWGWGHPANVFQVVENEETKSLSAVPYYLPLGFEYTNGSGGNEWDDGQQGDRQQGDEQQGDEGGLQGDERGLQGDEQDDDTKSNPDAGGLGRSEKLFRSSEQVGEQVGEQAVREQAVREQVVGGEGNQGQEQDYFIKVNICAAMSQKTVGIFTSNNWTEKWKTRQVTKTTNRNTSKTLESLLENRSEAYRSVVDIEHVNLNVKDSTSFYPKEYVKIQSKHSCKEGVNIVNVKPFAMVHPILMADKCIEYNGNKIMIPPSFLIPPAKFVTGKSEYNKNIERNTSPEILKIVKLLNSKSDVSEAETVKERDEDVFTMFKNFHYRGEGAVEGDRPFAEGGQEEEGYGQQLPEVFSDTYGDFVESALRTPDLIPKLKKALEGIGSFDRNIALIPGATYTLKQMTNSKKSWRSKGIYRLSEPDQLKVGVPVESRLNTLNDRDKLISKLSFVRYLLQYSFGMNTAALVFEELFTDQELLVLSHLDRVRHDDNLVDSDFWYEGLCILKNEELQPVETPGGGEVAAGVEQPVRPEELIGPAGLEERSEKKFRSYNIPAGGVKPGINGSPYESVYLTFYDFDNVLKSLKLKNRLFNNTRSTNEPELYYSKKKNALKTTEIRSRSKIEDEKDDLAVLSVMMERVVKRLQALFKNVESGRSEEYFDDHVLKDLDEQVLEELFPDLYHRTMELEAQSIGLKMLIENRYVGNMVKRLKTLRQRIKANPGTEIFSKHFGSFVPALYHFMNNEMNHMVSSCDTLSYIDSRFPHHEFSTDEDRYVRKYRLPILSAVDQDRTKQKVQFYEKTCTYQINELRRTAKRWSKYNENNLQDTKVKGATGLEISYIRSLDVRARYCSTLASFKDQVMKMTGYKNDPVFYMNEMSESNIVKASMRELKQSRVFSSQAFYVLSTMLSDHNFNYKSTAIEKSRSLNKSVSENKFRSALSAKTVTKYQTVTFQKDRRQYDTPFSNTKVLKVPYNEKGKFMLVQNDPRFAPSHLFFPTSHGDIESYTEKLQYNNVVSNNGAMLFSMLDAAGFAWSARKYSTPGENVRPDNPTNGHQDRMHYWSRTLVESFVNSREVHTASKEVTMPWEVAVKIFPDKCFKSSMIGGICDRTWKELFPLLPKSHALRSKLERVRSLNVMWYELKGYQAVNIDSKAFPRSEKGAWIPLPVSHQIHLMKRVGLYDEANQIPVNPWSLREDGKAGLLNVFNQSYHSPWPMSADSGYFKDWLDTACSYQIANSKTFKPFTQYGGHPVEADFVHHVIERPDGDVVSDKRHAELIEQRYGNINPIRMGKMYEDTGLLQNMFSWKLSQTVKADQRQKDIFTSSIRISNFLAYARVHTIMALGSCNPGTHQISETRAIRNFFRLNVDTYKCAGKESNSDGVPVILGYVTRKTVTEDEPSILFIAGTMNCINSQLAKFCNSSENKGEKVCPMFKQLYFNEATILFEKLLRQERTRHRHAKNFARVKAKDPTYTIEEFDKYMLDLKEEHISFLQHIIIGMLQQLGLTEKELPLGILEPRDFYVDPTESQDTNLVGNDFLSPSTLDTIDGIDFSSDEFDYTQMSILALTPPDVKAIAMMKLSQQGEPVDSEYLKKQFQQKVTKENKNLWRDYAKKVVQAGLGAQWLEGNRVDLAFDPEQFKNPTTEAEVLMKNKTTGTKLRDSEFSLQKRADELKKSKTQNSASKRLTLEHESAIAQLDDSITKAAKKNGTTKLTELASRDDLPSAIKRKLARMYMA